MASVQTQRVNWHELLKQFFQVGDKPIFLAGCFARHLTLYSQQVRSLNLITALKETDKLRRGTRVVIIGGGAAGLMAAAGATYWEAEVTIIDQLSKPMGLQRNSRQRYLHPFLYDWPKEEYRQAEAKLPFFPWTANYAANVAGQIEASWKQIVKQSKGRIHEFWNVSKVAVEDRIPGVSWIDSEGQTHDPSFDLVIFAVGFGLEPRDRPWRNSYWSDDSIDGDFHRDRERRVLVTGVGDGGLVDVMRLCIQDFRHDKVFDLIRDVAGLDQLGLELRRLHEQKDLDSRGISEAFRKKTQPESVNGAGKQKSSRPTSVHASLMDRLRPHIRTHGDVFLVGQSGHLYGPNSSILNRLIISQLQRLRGFQYLSDRTTEIQYDGATHQYKVSFHYRGPEYFDQVIERHGPKPHAIQSFPNILAACDALSKNWTNVSIYADMTRRPLWSQGVYGETGAASAGRAAVSAMGLSIWKDVCEDGSCKLSYLLEGLSVKKGALHGVYFSFDSRSGVVGEPQLNDAAKSLEITWNTDRKISPDNSAEDMGEHFRRVAGEFRFQKPLKAGQAPITFGFFFSIFNGHARTVWEFDQMYSRQESRPGRKKRAGESFTRYIPFPIENLKIHLHLPPSIPTQPRVRVCESRSRRDPINSRGILQLDQRNAGKPSQQSNVVASTNAFLEMRPGNTWELVVSAPKVGRSYGLEWCLPELPVFAELAEVATLLRKRLYEHGQARTNQKPGDQKIQRAFMRLVRAVCVKYARFDTVESFDISLATYADDYKRIVIVDTTNNGKTRQMIPPGFEAPFGLSIAGACFKEADKIQLYKRREVTSDSPSLYLPSRDPDRRHQILLAAPVFVPGFHEEGASHDPRERSRYCIAVINIGSTSVHTKLSPGVDEKGLKWINQQCKQFANECFPDSNVKMLG